MQEGLKEELRKRAEIYEDPRYFTEDPIAFPKEFLRRGASLQDVEIAALLSAHLAWGRRAMIVRDCTRLFEQMQWHPYDYILSGHYRDDDASLHRTIKWSEIALICKRLKDFYSVNPSLEAASVEQIRCEILGSKNDPSAPNKKLHMMRRWMVRGGKVDLGLWKSIRASELIIPLDVHVHAQALSLGLTRRNSRDMRTAMEITDCFREIWPEDPLKGDFALFGYGVTHA